MKPSLLEITHDNKRSFQYIIIGLVEVETVSIEKEFMRAIHMD